jgi:HD-like signal output (HDOD) protein
MKDGAMGDINKIDQNGRVQREQLARRIREIPTLPAVVQHLFTLINKPHSTAAQLEEVIKNDQSLSAKILAAANSAFYGFSQKITTIQRAVIALGLQEVRQLALKVSLIINLKPKATLPGLDFSQLWLHALATAKAAHILSKHFHGINPDLSYVAGLMHDLGKVLFYTHFLEDLQGILALKEKYGFLWPDAEAAYGLYHSELGGWVGEAWGLPPDIIGPIRHHHHPQRTSPHFLNEAIICLADNLANLAGFKFMTAEPCLLNTAIVGQLNLTSKDMEAVWKIFMQKTPEIKLYWQGLMSS